MNELHFQESRQGGYLLFALSGIWNQETGTKLESRLQAVVTIQDSDLILLECSKLQSLAKECLTGLRKLAETLSQQGRELALCTCPETWDIVSLITPPLIYYKNKDEALKAYQESKAPAGDVSDLLLLPTVPILKIQVIQGPAQGSATLKEKGEIVIGRHSKCDLSLAQDLQSSRFHCRCYVKNGKFFLEDLKSCNGTLYREVLLESEIELRDGDIFQVGDSRIQASIITEQKHGVIGTSVCSNLPKLELPKEEEKEWELEKPSQLISSSKNAEGLSILSKLALEGADTVKVAVSQSDIDHLSSLYASRILRQDKPVEAGERPLSGPMPTSDKGGSVYAEGEMGDAQDLGPLLLPIRIPTPIVRTCPSSPLQEILKNQYQIQDTVGESNTCWMLKCRSLQNGSNVFVQYAKEPMKLKELGSLHPYLLLPNNKEELQSRPLRVYSAQSFRQLPTTMTELFAIQLAMQLVDLLESFHAAGITGLDIAPCHVLLNDNGLARFAMIPAACYSGIADDKADIFSIGIFFLELLTGLKRPYTPLGGLDEEKIQQQLRPKASAPLCDLIWLILRCQLQELDKIESRLRELLAGMLTPYGESNKMLKLQIIKGSKSIVYFTDEQQPCQLAVSDETIRELSQKILTAPDLEQLTKTAKDLYRHLLPFPISSWLNKNLGKKLQLLVDDELQNIPWELLHSGKQFCSADFSLARSSWSLANGDTKKSPLLFPKILLLADTCAWAQEAKQQFLTFFQKEFPLVKIKAFDTTDSPTEIVRQIPQYGIWHILGSSQYQSEAPWRSGWLLSGNKMIKLRLLENAPRKPRLIFHQAETQPAGSIGKFLSLVFQTGVDYVIGSLWLKKTATFPLAFYRNLFQGLSVDQAISQTMKSVHDDFRNSLPPIFFGRQGLPLIQKMSR